MYFRSETEVVTNIFNNLTAITDSKNINYSLDKLSPFSPLLIVCQAYANVVSFPDL